jgi:hypothetical protein
MLLLGSLLDPVHPSSPLLAISRVDRLNIYLQKSDTTPVLSYTLL